MRPFIQTRVAPNNIVQRKSGPNKVPLVIPYNIEFLLLMKNFCSKYPPEGVKVCGDFDRVSIRLGG